MASGAAPSREGPVHRAFGLLQAVVASDDPVGVRELARRVGVSRSTTARMLGILDELGMVERTDNGAARPGTGLATLTRRVEDSPAVLRDRLRPLTVELQRTYAENAAIGVDDTVGFRYLDSARAPAAVQVADPSGEVFPFHLVAPGLVVMTAWPESRLDEYLRQPPERATINSVTASTAVRHRLNVIRELGYAWTDEELDLDVNGVAVPVRDARGEVVAAMSLYGPAYRLSEAALPGLGAAFAALVHDRAGVLLAA